MRAVNIHTKTLSVLAGVLLAALLANNASAYTEKTLYKFCQDKCTDGAYPHDLVMDSQGNLYGATDIGGNNDKSKFMPGNGTVFEYTPGTGQYQVLYRFCSLANCPDGSNPYRVKLVIDTKGNLYGTTFSGGSTMPSGGAGVAFELIRKKSGWEEKVLTTFCTKLKSGCIGGAHPAAGLTYEGAAAGVPYDGVSPLYGTTMSGDGSSTVFALVPGKGKKGWKKRVLHTFCQEDDCTDGEDAKTDLYIDNEGNLYGTTDFGGQSGKGTIYELSPAGNGTYNFKVIYSFCAEDNCTDGELPQGGVVMDAAGNLLGSAAGGASGDGVIFQMSPQGGTNWQYSVLASFDGKDGAGPGNLTLGSDGSLFGATLGGGANRSKKGGGGTVFQYNGAIQSLYSFCAEPSCADGRQPFGGVIQDAEGNLFGTTEKRGGENTGVLFELVNDHPAHHGK